MDMQGSASISPVIQEICCYLYTGFSFVRAAVACAILERTPGFEPSSEIIAISYLKLVTVRSFCPLTLISLWVPLVLFVISFVFLALISILYHEQAWSRLSARTFSSFPSAASASMPSVNPVQDDFQHYFTWTTNKANGSVILTEL